MTAETARQLKRLRHGFWVQGTRTKFDAKEARQGDETDRGQ